MEKIQELEERCGEMQKLQGQWQESQRQLQETGEELKLSREQFQKAQARIAELEQLKTPPPTFVKENKKKPKEGEKKPRKKREAKYNRGRARSATPTETVEHRLVNCPDWKPRLGGITQAREREVIDIPPPPAVSITQHRIAPSVGVPIVRSGMKRQWTRPRRGVRTRTHWGMALQSDCDPETR